MTDLPDEETIRVRRTGSDRAQPRVAQADASEVSDVAEPADVTEISAGRISADTVPAMPEPDQDGPIRRRATYVGTAAEGDPPTDGSTIIAHRESRRRAARDSAGDHTARSDPSGRSARPGPPRTPPSPSPAPQGSRVASAPDAAASGVYRARAANPVVASRAAAPERSPQSPVDGDAATAARRHRSRRTALIVVIAASGVAVIAASSLILLMFTQG